MKVELEERLPLWVGEELLAQAQADAILAAERRRSHEVVAGGPRIGLLAEALGYLGAVLAIVALGLLLTEVWDQLAAWSRVLLAVLVTGATWTAGFVLRRSEEPALRRLVSVLWAATVVGTAFTVGLALSEFTDLREEDVTLAVALPTTLVAAGLYAFRRTAVQHLALYVGSLVSLGAAVGRLPTELDPLFWGLVFLGIGLAWAALAWSDLLAPRSVGIVIGLLTAGVGAQSMAFSDDPVVGLLAGIVVAGGLIVLSIADRRTLFLAMGSLGVFVFVPQLVFEWFGDSLGAPFALLITGLLLIVGAVGAARLKSEVIDEDRPEVSA